MPDVREYPGIDLMRKEREVTGLYLSGHPMDEYRNMTRKTGAVNISEILSDFSREGGAIKFSDNQQIIVAGILEDVKTKPTRNNSLMAYLPLDDSSGSIEMLAFQRTIDEFGAYMQTNTPVLVTGSLSARDEKDPQIVVNTLRPIQGLGDGGRERGETKEGRAALGDDRQDRALCVKLRSEDSPEYERLKLVHMMFPGSERMVIHFGDTKKTVGAKCVIHEAFVNELRESLGEENVVVR
jgi:DNA polymerase-3 subunit alpha